MAYWTWTLSGRDKAAKPGYLRLPVAHDLTADFPADVGDRLLLLSRAGQIVGVAEIELLPGHRENPPAWILGGLMNCRELVQVPDSLGLPETELERPDGTSPHQDLVQVKDEVGDKIFAALRESAQQAGGERWLPDQPKPIDPRSLPPWRPQTLGSALDDDELERQAYVTVDEIIGDGVGLLLAPWPGQDENGRLRFAPEQAQQLVGADRNSLLEFLRRERIVMVMSFEGQLDEETAAKLRERELEIGDVFAIRRDVVESVLTTEGGLKDGEWSAEFSRLEDQVRVYDITVEARQRAKVAMAAALAGPLDEATARDVLGAAPIEESAAETEAAEPLGAGPEGVVRADELEGGLES